jgi:hypothetical protein
MHAGGEPVSGLERTPMPVHDWTRVDAGLFHHFHQRWTAALCDALNSGGLPPGYFALAEQIIGGLIPDVLTLRHMPETGSAPGSSLGPAVLTAPRTRYVRRAEVNSYAQRANRVTVRHEHGQLIAVIEIVSPGNKSGRAALRAFVRKMTDLLDQSIHLLLVDLIPPGSRDPQGIHKAIWDEVIEEQFELPSDKPLTLVAYEAGPVKIAYVEPVAVGDTLPDMPLFLAPELHVRTPLEATYQATWNVFPAALKGLLEGPPLKP